MCSGGLRWGHHPRRAAPAASQRPRGPPSRTSTPGCDAPNSAAIASSSGSRAAGPSSLQRQPLPLQRRPRRQPQQAPAPRGGCQDKALPAAWQGGAPYLAWQVDAPLVAWRGGTPALAAAKAAPALAAWPDLLPRWAWQGGPHRAARRVAPHCPRARRARSSGSVSTLVLRPMHARGRRCVRGRGGEGAARLGSHGFTLTDLCLLRSSRACGEEATAPKVTPAAFVAKPSGDATANRSKVGKPASECRQFALATRSAPEARCLLQFGAMDFPPGEAW